MKLVKLSLFDTLSTLKRSFMFLLVIILGISSALSTHIIAAGVIDEDVAKQREYPSYNTITLTNLSTLDESVYEKIVSMDHVKNAFCFFPSEEGYTLVGWYGESPDRWFPLGEGRFVSKEPSEKTAYTSSDIAQYEPNKEQQITVGEQKFTVVGSTALWFLNLTTGLDKNLFSNNGFQSQFVFIHLSELLQMNFSDGCLRIHFEPGSIGSNRFGQIARDILGTSYDENTLHLPSDPAKDFLAANTAFFVLIGSLCLLSYMNVIAMYWFYLSTQKRTYHIYTIVGAKKKQLLTLLLVNYLTLFVISFGLAVLFSALMKPLFGMITVSYSLSWNALLPVFGFELLVTSIISIPKMSNLLKTHGVHSLLRRGNG